MGFHKRSDLGGNEIKPGFDAPGRRRAAELAVVAILYLALTLLCFFPCLKTFSGALIGPPEDNQLYFWDLWWFTNSLASPELQLAYSHFIFYPEGSSLAFNSFPFFNLFLGWLIQPVVGPVAAYNLLILFSFVLAGLGMFLLLRYLVGDFLASFVGGFVFAFNPSHFGHSLHHLELTTIGFLPLFTLCFIKAVRTGRRRDLVGAAVFYLLSALSAWYYLVFPTVFMLAAYGWLACRRWRLVLPDLLAKIGIIVGSAALILSPWLVPMLVTGLQYPEIVLPGHDTNVVDLAGLVVPDPYHLFGRTEPVAALNRRFTGYPWEFTGYLGLANLLLIALAYRNIRREAGPCLLGLLGFLFLALGPRLHVLGTMTAIVLPFELAKHLPLLAHMRAPGRFIVYAYLFLGIVVALAVKQLWAATAASTRRRAGLVALLALLFLDFGAVCTETTPVYLPPAYRAIPASGEPFGILELPYRYYDQRRQMLFQTRHGIPTTSGYISRKVGSSLLERLETTDLERQRAQLLEAKVKYIVVHKDLYPGGRAPSELAALDRVYRPLYEDPTHIVLQVY